MLFLGNRNAYIILPFTSIYWCLCLKCWRHLPYPGTQTAQNREKVWSWRSRKKTCVARRQKICLTEVIKQVEGPRPQNWDEGAGNSTTGQWGKGEGLERGFSALQDLRLCVIRVCLFFILAHIHFIPLASISLKWPQCALSSAWCWGIKVSEALPTHCLVFPVFLKIRRLF